MTGKETCFKCGYKLEKHSSIHEGRKYVPGAKGKSWSIPICMRCGEVHIFDESFRLRLISGAELKEIFHDDIAEFENIVKTVLTIKHLAPTFEFLRTSRN